MSYWSVAYKFGWATKEQLKQAVAGKLISAAEYQSITGKELNGDAN